MGGVGVWDGRCVRFEGAHRLRPVFCRHPCDATRCRSQAQGGGPLPTVGALGLGWPMLQCGRFRERARACLVEHRWGCWGWDGREAWGEWAGPTEEKGQNREERRDKTDRREGTNPTEEKGQE